MSIKTKTKATKTNPLTSSFGRTRRRTGSTPRNDKSSKKSSSYRPTVNYQIALPPSSHVFILRFSKELPPRHLHTCVNTNTIALRMNEPNSQTTAYMIPRTKTTTLQNPRCLCCSPFPSTADDAPFGHRAHEHRLRLPENKASRGPRQRRQPAILSLTPTSRPCRPAAKGKKQRRMKRSDWSI